MLAKEFPLNVKDIQSLFLKSNEIDFLCVKKRLSFFRFATVIENKLINVNQLPVIFTVRLYSYLKSHCFLLIDQKVRLIPQSKNALCYLK